MKVKLFDEVKEILASKKYTVQCQYTGSHVPDCEMDRANEHGEHQLKNVNDIDIVEAIEDVFEDLGEDTVSGNILGILAEKDYETPYDNISFVVHIHEN
jgi:hypothetical protein